MTERFGLDEGDAKTFLSWIHLGVTVSNWHKLFKSVCMWCFLIALMDLPLVTLLIFFLLWASGRSDQSMSLFLPDSFSLCL